MTLLRLGRAHNTAPQALTERGQTNGVSPSASYLWHQPRAQPPLLLSRTSILSRLRGAPPPLSAPELWGSQQESQQVHTGIVLFWHSQRGFFSCSHFFFFLTEVVCVSPWHFPSKQLHQKIPDQPSPPPAQLRCGRSTAGCSWRLPQDFPGQAGSSPAPWGSALQQEPWSENSFVLYSLQNPAGARQQISTPVGCWCPVETPGRCAITSL